MPEERLVALAAGAPAAAPLIALMEAEFVAGKGRGGALAVLYPDLFASPRFGRLFALTRGDEPRAACAVRLFTVRIGAAKVPAAMIGFVVTAPSHRRQGFGARLMQATEAQLAGHGVEVGVLWARRAHLYLTLGWKPADTSLLGRWQGEAAMPDLDWSKPPFAAPLRQRLNRLRPAPAIARPAIVYDKRPYPAERLWLAARRGAYALIGEAGETGYVFELGGRPELAPGLLAAAARRWPALSINGAIGEPISDHLRNSGHVAFERNPLAMWKGLRRPFDVRRAPWVPYFDRV